MPDESGLPRMKVLHIISTLDVGGAEQNLLRLVSSMDKDLFENLAVCMTRQGAVGQKLELTGTPVYSLNMKKGIPDPRAILKLRFLANLLKPDLIQCWMYHANLLGLALLNPHRTLWNIRCSDMDLSLYGRIYRYTVLAGARLSTLPEAVIANSHAGIEVHRSLGYHPRHWAVIPNGFDANQFSPNPAARSEIRDELNIPGDAFAIGLICRYDPMKDHATFFHAARIFHQTHPDTYFILAGRGVSRENPAFRKLLPEEPLQEKCRLLGERNDVHRIFASLDVASSSSAWGEGLPNTIGEAMACGLPCVTTDTGDAALLVGETGFIVKRQSPQELNNAWDNLYRISSEDRREMGRKARQRIIDGYSQNKTTRMYEDLYREIIR